MFHVFSLRPWKRTYATECVAAACRAMTFDARVIGRVDGYVREPVRLEERERVGTLVGLHPRPVAELDERNERLEPRANAFELGERIRRLDEPWVVLHEDPAELARQLERLERRAERSEGVVVRLALVPRHRLVRLDVERELGWCPLSPVQRHPRIGEVVVRRVDLDRVEALRVVRAGGPSTSRRRVGTTS